MNTDAPITSVAATAPSESVASKLSVSVNGAVTCDSNEHRTHRHKRRRSRHKHHHHHTMHRPKRLHHAAKSFQDDPRLLGRKATSVSSLPILVCIQLAAQHSQNGDATDMSRSRHSSTVLFRDYVLIPAVTKFKYLVNTIVDQVNLENKQSFQVLDGKWKLQFFKFIRKIGIYLSTYCEMKYTYSLSIFHTNFKKIEIDLIN